VCVCVTILFISTLSTKVVAQGEPLLSEKKRGRGRGAPLRAASRLNVGSGAGREGLVRACKAVPSHLR
jgi:hypothetical protein